MGRKRAIDQQQVLDAAERVVGRDGAANLTVDAVAREAGVSKASVLYDYKSKQALIDHAPKGVAYATLKGRRGGSAMAAAAINALATWEPQEERQP